MAIVAYDFAGADIFQQFLERHFPERTNEESALFRDWLVDHVRDFDRYQLSVRVGTPQAILPGVPAGVARSIAYSSRKRIDILAWRGEVATVGELKLRLTPACLGQLLTYRQLLLEEIPTLEEPALMAIGRQVDEDTLRVLQTHGITVYVYPAVAAA